MNHSARSVANRSAHPVAAVLSICGCRGEITSAANVGSCRLTVVWLLLLLDFV